MQSYLWIPLKHFVRQTNCSPNKQFSSPNYEAHIAVDNFVYAKENGIVILTPPPHWSDHMQPVDKTVFKLSDIDHIDNILLLTERQRNGLAYHFWY